MDWFPRKFFIKDLKDHLSEHVWIQGTVEQTVNNDILIISDGTDRAKITGCGSADGVIDKATLKKGTYCCIVGTVTSTKGVPEVRATKFQDLSYRPHMKASWEYEVKEANLFLQGRLCPTE